MNRSSEYGTTSKRGGCRGWPCGLAMDVDVKLCADRVTVLGPPVRVSMRTKGPPHMGPARADEAGVFSVWRGGSCCVCCGCAGEGEMGGGGGCMVGGCMVVRVGGAGVVAQTEENGRTALFALCVGGGAGVARPCSCAELADTPVLGWPLLLGDPCCSDSA